MKTIATASGEIGPAQRGLMKAAQKVILGIEADIDALPVITPAELAAGFQAGELRQQFVNGMLVTAVADGVPSRETLAKVEAFAKALGITEPVLADLRLLADNHMTIFKLDLLRRGHIGDIMRNELALKGPLGFAKSVLRMRGMTEDAALAARYHAWGKLPEGTLGRGLFDFYKQHGFTFPGERGGFPEAGLYHDFSHLLGGDKWDYWQWIEMPIEEVRQRMNILPKAER